MKNSFCTISTANYLPYVLSLYDSLLKFNLNQHLNVLISDEVVNFSQYREKYPNIFFYYSNELCKDGIGKKIFEKYHAENMDCFRWSMKSVFMTFLLQEKGYEKIICVDNDIYFFNDYSFLFSELNHNDILLTPHWRNSDPTKGISDFFSLYTQGLYNGGFVSSNKNGTQALEWWANTCHFICARDDCNGQFDDQAHLNLMPIYFDNVKILKHRGCNVAGWNQEECQRTKEGELVKINKEYPIIFIHFTKGTIKDVLYGNDKNLDSFLNIYFDALKKHDVDLKKKYEEEYELSKKKEIKKSFIQKLSDKIRIQKRIKAFMDG